MRRLYAKFFQNDERRQLDYKESSMATFDPDHRWTADDSRLASAEGWDVFDIDGSGICEIQRCDEAQRFDGDESAVAYVADRACNGSQLHTKAWTIHVRHRMEAGYE